MKILIVAPHIKIPGLSGAAVHHTEFSKSLGKLGIEVHLLADSEKEIKLSENVFLHPSNASKIPPKRFLTSLNSVGKIMEICKSNNIDVIHDRCDPGQVAGYIAAKLLGMPRLSEINENQLAYEIKGNFVRDVLIYPFLILIKKFWMKNIAADGDAVTTVSKTIKESMIRHGVNPKKIFAIPNGSNLTSTSKPMSLKKFGIKKGDTVASVIGELGPRQGIMEIVEAFKELDSPKLKLILVGGEERYKKYLDTVSQFVKENGLDKRIIFAGRIPHDEINNFLAAVDLALAPYRESWNKESFGFCPVKILDYMAAGKVVIATDTKWTRELVENRKDGFLVPYENITEGVRKIIRGLDSKTRKRIERNAKEKILREYTWDHIASRYEKIYEVLSAHKNIESSQNLNIL